MKANIGLVLLILQISIVAMATSKHQEFKFKYTYKGERLELIETSNSWESSFEKSALKCFKHFSRGQALPESTGLDIIDVCANPRS